MPAVNIGLAKLLGLRQGKLPIICLRCVRSAGLYSMAFQLTIRFFSLTRDGSHSFIRYQRALKTAIILRQRLSI